MKFKGQLLYLGTLSPLKSAYQNTNKYKIVDIHIAMQTSASIICQWLKMRPKNKIKITIVRNRHFFA